MMKRILYQEDSSTLSFLDELQRSFSRAPISIVRRGDVTIQSNTHWIDQHEAMNLLGIKNSQEFNLFINDAKKKGLILSEREFTTRYFLPSIQKFLP